MVRQLWSSIQQQFDRRPRVVLGSAGPFIGTWDLGWFQYSLPLDKLDTHLYVVGRSGKGKSKFLESLLFQLIIHGQGCGVIDPHADLANNLLKLLAGQPVGPDQRPWLADPTNAQRLIYCEPGRNDYLIPMNLLVSSDKPYTIATNVIEAFQRTWSSSLAEAPQFKNVALHSLLLLIEHQLSLCELPHLLMNASLRDRLLVNSQQPEIVAFFKERFSRWGREQALRVESILNKVTALTLNDSLKLMLGATENRLDLRQIMDQRKILIVNLGTCDHETRDLLGSLLTVRLEQAALSRVELDEHQRVPFFMLLDEFQRLCANEGSSQVLAHILSEVRKMKLRLCLAHQGWHQLDSSRLEGAIDQAQIKVVFGSGHQTARVIVDELFAPDPEKIKHQVADSHAQERTHPQFESLAEQREIFIQAIRKQKRREVYVLPPENDQVVALRTVTVPHPQVASTDLEVLKAGLIHQIGQPVAELAETISQRQASLREPGSDHPGDLQPNGDHLQKPVSATRNQFFG